MVVGLPHWGGGVLHWGILAQWMPGGYYMRERLRVNNVPIFPNLHFDYNVPESSNADHAGLNNPEFDTALDSP